MAKAQSRKRKIKHEWNFKKEMMELRKYSENIIYYQKSKPLLKKKQEKAKLKIK